MADDFGMLLPALTRNGVNLAGADGTGEPVISLRLIEFNGAGDSGCEPFRLEREIGDPHMGPAGRMSNFRDPGGRETNPRAVEGKIHLYTKTEHYPYDLAVTACLIIAKRRLGKGIVVCSDGSEEKWDPAKRLCKNHFGYGGSFRLDRE